MSPHQQLPNTYRAFYGAFATLHLLQRDIIAPILAGQDVILQAATGSGKTEAVLAPCVERLLASGGTLAVLYVVPTRALAQDLRRRLEPVLHERLGVRLGIRTGDVKYLPSGTADVLLTTPESLDVMLGSPNREVQRFLQRVQVVVIDEVHQFLSGYRGRHLAYLIQRLTRHHRQRLQKIALSATVAAPETIRVAFGLQPGAVYLHSAVQRAIQPRLVCLQREHEELVVFVDDLVERFGHRKLLLFANSRSRCDRLFALLSQHGHLREATYLHYSNLKSRQRQEVEKQFQRRSQALCITTSTLELGIDIGDVDGVLLYEPPESVTTFVQRLGRANRQTRYSTFWGLCRGPQAGEQLVQFLALYRLAQQGVVEDTPLQHLPSVLVQQVLSVLYAYKNITLTDLQGLFPPQAEELALLWPHLERQAWLRQSTDHGQRWRGGWRYAQALRARQIWSNFPDLEVVYILQVDGEAVADLPLSIVRQLEVGDDVDLAGRRLRIGMIEEGARNVVHATPVHTPETKELVWLGSGPPVSWEVAQAVQQVLASEDVLHDAELMQGLFARPRTLLRREVQRAQRRVLLHNGIELSRTAQGLYRYATYLGSLGNTILQRTMTAYYEPRLEEFHCTVDALAIDSTHLVDLQALPLPVGRDALSLWVGQHLYALRAFLPLNTFSRALPRAMLVEEITDWLWDERVSQAFARYRQQPSSIAQGDPCLLEWEDMSAAATARAAAPVVLRQGPVPSLLEQAQGRLGVPPGTRAYAPDVPSKHQTPRALTGTMLSTYMQHRQCARLLSFDLLPFDQQPPKRTLLDSAVGAVRAGQGRAYEAQVLDWLQQQGVAVLSIPAQDSSGRRLSLHERQRATWHSLQTLLAGYAAGATADTLTSRPDFGAGEQAQSDVEMHQHGVLGVLVQPVLLLPEYLGAAHPMARQVEGVGILDMLEVTVHEATAWLTVADIKDSAAPRYAQKWQVAFYAALLRACLPAHAFALPVRLAPHGVIVTRPQDETAAPTRHAFTLAPYLDALPLLQRQIATVLTTPLLQADWQVQAHCRSCGYVEACSRQALSTYDVMLVPHLTPGEHLKLRTLGLHTVPQAAAWFQEASTASQTVLSPPQGATLGARVRALSNNRLEVVQHVTSLYPANLGTALFLHVQRDPRHEHLRVWGLHRLVRDTSMEVPHCWVAASAADVAACQQAFVTCLRAWWREAIAAGQGPHVLVFNNADLRMLREALQDAPDPTALDFLWSPDRHTAIQHLLRQHFAWPVPLHLSLAAAAQVWGIAAETDEEDNAELLLQETLESVHIAQLEDAMQSHLLCLQGVWQACVAVLQSDWQQRWEEAMTDGTLTLAGRCEAFLEQQRCWRERDVLAVQRLPLSERVERYRALGPLTFETTSLDTEGRFLYHFRLPPETAPGRFRAGDFLKLNAMGSLDLQEGTGVILAAYAPYNQTLAVVSRQGRPALSTRLAYTLEEDLDDWTTPKVLHAVREAFSAGKHVPLTALLAGALPIQRPAYGLAWAQKWVAQVGLNARQRDAVLLPFRSPVGLLEGPPGTGKTHVLACMLIALILEAQQGGRPLRLAVSALTHQAIDNLLRKVQQLLQSSFPGMKTFVGRCLKWGQRSALQVEDDPLSLTYVDDADDVLTVPYLILGATGFGLYTLFDSQRGAFPAFFDWVVLDEASQMLLPQALLSLVYGKGQYVLCGDVQQLPPVILGSQPAEETAVPSQSILAHCLAVYGPEVRVRLNETYRLNQELCQLPSKLWYQGDLRPAATQATARLVIPPVSAPDILDAILAPERPATLVLADHHIDSQRSLLEVEIVATLAVRLLLDYGITAERLAILAPHRAQNSAIAQRLAQLLAQRGVVPVLPVIDTVERLQGAERDVVLFSVTTSDPDQRHSPFLNNANRFNVAITRARYKLVVVGSHVFFTQVPHTEATFHAHAGFTAYYHLCAAQSTLFAWPVCAL